MCTCLLGANWAIGTAFPVPLAAVRSAASPFDLDANGAAHGQRVGLLDPYPDAFDARICQAVPGDALGQRLDEIDVLVLHQQGDALEQRAVVEHILQPVGNAIIVVAHGQIRRQQDALLVAFFVLEDADAGDDFEIIDEHVAPAGLPVWLGAGTIWGCGGCRHGGQLAVAARSAVRQSKCWPPSRASICPVSAGACKIKRMAAAISAGSVRRPSKVAWYSARN